MEEDNSGSGTRPPESLMPYEEWTEDALRGVMVRALRYAAEQGLPGEHHFYLTFRTDLPGVTLPARLRAQYPEEMTIVLQHQFWDLMVDDRAAMLSVGLSFGGVPSTLAIPLGAISAFADPYVGFALRFQIALPGEEEMPEPEAPEAEAEDPAAAPEEASATAEPPPGEAPQVVSLDAFRRRPPQKTS